MTIAQLIEKLKAHNPDAIAVIHFSQGEGIHVEVSDVTVHEDGLKVLSFDFDNVDENGKAKYTYTHHKDVAEIY